MLIAERVIGIVIRGAVLVIAGTDRMREAIKYPDRLFADDDYRRTARHEKLLASFVDTIILKRLPCLVGGGPFGRRISKDSETAICAIYRNKK